MSTEVISYSTVFNLCEQVVAVNQEEQTIEILHPLKGSPEEIANIINSIGKAVLKQLKIPFAPESTAIAITGFHLKHLRNFFCIYKFGRVNTPPCFFMGYLFNTQKEWEHLLSRSENYFKNEGYQKFSIIYSVESS